MLGKSPDRVFAGKGIDVLSKIFKKGYRIRKYRAGYVMLETTIEADLMAKKSSII